METTNKELAISFRKFAQTVYWFHFGWIIMMITGTVVEIFYKPYAPYQLTLVALTFLFQLLGRGHCPLTVLENLLWEKVDKEKMYLHPETYEGSFLRYIFKKYLKIKTPRGTTLILLILILAVTLIQILS